VNVRVKVNELPKRLDTGDHAGNGIGFSADRLSNLPDHLPREATHISQKTPIGPKINPQPLRDREDKLTMGNTGRHLLIDEEGRLQGPFLVATGTQRTPAAGKSDEELVATLRTPDPRETLAGITTT
jgi:hypothetical protein